MMERLLAIMEKFEAKMIARHKDMMAITGADHGDTGLSGEVGGNSTRNEIHS
jgi:hypothetical protein